MHVRPMEVDIPTMENRRRRGPRVVDGVDDNNAVASGGRVTGSGDAGSLGALFGIFGDDEASAFASDSGCPLVESFILLHW